MDTTLLVHVAAGGGALISGYVALYARKGAPVHRRSGTVFVWTMLTMCTVGASIAALRDAAPTLNVPVGALTSYLVVTGLLAVRPPFRGRRWVEVAATAFVFGVTAAFLSFGMLAVSTGVAIDGMPTVPYFMFGAVGLLAGLLDLRWLRRGPLTGVPRLRRHLWRISTALLIAAMSFFLGQADEIPAPLRVLPLLALPVVAVLVTMLYWLWRVRRRTPATRPARPVVVAGTRAVSA